MNDELRRAWSQALTAARGWDGGDPEPVLEALGLVLVLEVTGDLMAIAGDERALLRDRGRRALLSGAPPEVDADDLRLLRSLGRAGLDTLEGKPASPPGEPFHPTDGRLLRMLRGEPDGLGAGAAAAHVRGCDRCLEGLRVLDLASGRRVRPLAVAAAGAAAMRAPAEGRTVGRLAEPELDAVLFEEGGERRLAVYAASSAPLRVVAEGLTTEEMLGGYWLGRVEPGVRQIHATVHAGDASVAWDLDLTAR